MCHILHPDVEMDLHALLALGAGPDGALVVPFELNLYLRAAI
jgi:hypothetical protein